MTTADDDLKLVAGHLRASAAVKERMATELAPQIVAIASALITALRGGHKILICGNGGSAADAQHIAAELVGRYKRARPALPVIALTTDTSVLTAVGNDFGYDQVFARQVEALAEPGDVIVAITTSGRSPNIDQALQKAAEKGARTVALLGKDGGNTARLAQLVLIVPSQDTQHVQESHITIGHILCELVERAVVPEHSAASS